MRGRPPLQKGRLMVMVMVRLTEWQRDWLLKQGVKKMSQTIRRLIDREMDSVARKERLAKYEREHP